MPIAFRRRDNFKGAESERKIGQAVNAGFKSLGDDIVKDIQARLPMSNGGKFPRGVDRRHFKQGMRSRVFDGGLNTKLRIYNNVKHAEVVEEGREKGKTAPPSTAILAWVRRKGIGAKASSLKTRRQISAGTRRTFDRKAGNLRSRAKSLLNLQKGIAFVIARSIGREGIPGLFIFKNLESHYASKISSAKESIKSRIAQILNS